MRLARFSLNDSPRYAFVQKDETDGKDYLIELDGHPLAGDQVKPTGTRYPVDGDGIRLLSPVIPSKVYGLAKNYEAHAQFMHEAGHSEIAHAPEDMVIFTKPSTSVIGPDDPIVYPACSKDMNFEPEVAVVMGRIAKNVSVENAMDYVLGFTCVNDVTLRDLQGIDPTWTRAKGFDTSCPLGPWIVMRDDLDWKDAFEHTDEQLSRVEHLRETREATAAWLKEQTYKDQPLEVAESGSNFLLFGGHFDKREAIFDELLKRGVLIRVVGPDGWLRVCMGTDEEMETFRNALVEVLRIVEAA